VSGREGGGRAKDLPEGILSRERKITVGDLTSLEEEKNKKRRGGKKDKRGVWQKHEGGSSKDR